MTDNMPPERPPGAHASTAPQPSKARPLAAPDLPRQPQSQPQSQSPLSAASGAHGGDQAGSLARLRERLTLIKGHPMRQPGLPESAPGAYPHQPSVLPLNTPGPRLGIFARTPGAETAPHFPSAAPASVAASPADVALSENRGASPATPLQEEIVLWRMLTFGRFDDALMDAIVAEFECQDELSQLHMLNASRRGATGPTTVERKAASLYMEHLAGLMGVSPPMLTHLGGPRLPVFVAADQAPTDSPREPHYASRPYPALAREVREAFFDMLQSSGINLRPDGGSGELSFARKKLFAFVQTLLMPSLRAYQSQNRQRYLKVADDVPPEIFAAMAARSKFVRETPAFEQTWYAEHAQERETLRWLDRHGPQAADKASEALISAGIADPPVTDETTRLALERRDQLVDQQHPEFSMVKLADDAKLRVAPSGAQPSNWIVERDADGRPLPTYLAVVKATYDDLYNVDQSRGRRDMRHGGLDAAVGRPEEWAPFLHPRHGVEALVEIARQQGCLDPEQPTWKRQVVEEMASLLAGNPYYAVPDKHTAMSLVCRIINADSAQIAAAQKMLEPPDRSGRTKKAGAAAHEDTEEAYDNWFTPPAGGSDARADQ